LLPHEYSCGGFQYVKRAKSAGNKNQGNAVIFCNRPHSGTVKSRAARKRCNAFTSQRIRAWSLAFKESPMKIAHRTTVRRFYARLFFALLVVVTALLAAPRAQAQENASSKPMPHGTRKVTLARSRFISKP
jgi:hypothetical protein